MIGLAYSLLTEPDAGTDLRSASAEDLHYRLFTGDVVFRANDADFGTDWGWVPVLDFAVCLRSVAGSLVQEQVDEDRFEFTECDEAILFRRLGDRTQIGATFSDANAVVESSELLAASSVFLEQVFTELGARYPDLQGNSYFQGLLGRWSAPGP